MATKSVSPSKNKPSGSSSSSSSKPEIQIIGKSIKTTDKNLIAMKSGVGQLFAEVFEGKKHPDDSAAKGIPAKDQYEKKFLGATKVDDKKSGAAWDKITLKRAPKDSDITVYVFDEDLKKGKMGDTVGIPFDAASKDKKTLVGMVTIPWDTVTKNPEKAVDLDVLDAKGKSAGKVTIKPLGATAAKKESSEAKKSSSSSSKDKEKDEKEKGKSSSSSSKDKGSSSGGDKEGIEYLQKLARFQVDQATKKWQDAKDEVSAAQLLLDRLSRLAPRKTPGQYLDDGGARQSSPGRDRDLLSSPRSYRRGYDEYDDVSERRPISPRSRMTRRYSSDDDFMPPPRPYGPVRGYGPGPVIGGPILSGPGGFIGGGAPLGGPIGGFYSSSIPPLASGPYGATYSARGPLPADSFYR